MSCPDWQDLTDRRDADELDSATWRTALEHLDGCSDCQSEALAADPTLMFRRLPAPEVGDDEVAAMQQAVAGMRRRAKIAPRRASSTGPWMRAAAVAAVLLGSVLLSGSEPRVAPSDALDRVADSPIPIADASTAEVSTAAVSARGGLEAAEARRLALPEGPSLGSLALSGPTLDGFSSDGFSLADASVGAVEVVPMLVEARSASRLPLVEMANPSYGSIIEVVDQDISVVVVLPADA
ncbi:MAG: hypothetical protein AAF560_27410 [Acidobacteriota bacterium]